MYYVFPMKIKSKIFLLFFAISLLLISGFAVYISYFTRDSLRTKFFRRLEENARIVGKHTLEDNLHFGRMYFEVKRNYLRQLASGKDYVLLLEKGQTDIPKKPNLPLPKNFYSEAIQQGNNSFMQKDTAYMAIYLRDESGKKQVLIISSGIDNYGLAELAHLDNRLVTGGLVCMLLVALISFAFANHIIKPISLLSKEIENISLSSITRRLEKNPKIIDELSSLIDSFNNMLGRFQLSVNSQQSFLGNASHSFRTPLTVIRGEAELALKEPNLTPDVKLALDIIIEEADRMILMVNNLLKLFKTGMNEKEQVRKIVRMDEMIFQVVDAGKDVKPFKNIKIDFEEIPEDSNALQVRGNPDLLYIALSNIVSNACKYGAGGLVVISLAITKNKKIKIKISDKGIGIPSEEQAYIYDSFYRASNVGNIYGNGLGLLLAKNIIDLHGGEMFLSSKEGEGTHVTLLLTTCN